MKKKDYVKPNAQVLSLYTDEFMEGGFHTHSGIKGTRVRDKKRLVKVGNLVKNSYLYR